MKPKIAFTVINDLTYDQRMQRICTSLTEAGYEVELIGRILPNSAPLKSFPFRTTRLKCFFLKGSLFYAEYNIRLFIYLIFSKLDGICSIDLDTLLAGFWVGKIRRKPVIYDAHEYFTEVPEVVERPRVKAIWEVLANFIIPKVKFAYTVCESLAEIFQSRYGTSFEVIRNVPFAQKTEEKNLSEGGQKNKILLYQGALNDGRGIEELIDTMPHLEGVELWLAGEGDLSEELREKAKRLNVESKVKFLGYVLPDDLKAITQRADVGLNLLQNKGLNYYYSLANKCFDYIQAEKPAIHMNFPEYQKVNQRFEVSLLIDDLEVKTIKAAIQKITENPLIYNDLKRNCKAAKQYFIWEEESKKLIQYYDQIFLKQRL